MLHGSAVAASGRKGNNWCKLFQMGVWVHNTLSCRFSQLPLLPHYLCKRGRWNRERRGGYNRRCTTMSTWDPTVQLKTWVSSCMVLGNDEKCFVEVNRNSPQERDRYERFIKGANRHLIHYTNRTEMYCVKQVHTQRQWSEPKYLTRLEGEIRRMQCNKSNETWDGAEGQCLWDQ